MIKRFKKIILSSGLPDKEMAAMELGLAHFLSRYKLKFSPDKIDTMIVQVSALVNANLNVHVVTCRLFLFWMILTRS